MSGMNVWHRKKNNFQAAELENEILNFCDFVHFCILNFCDCIFQGFVRLFVVFVMNGLLVHQYASKYICIFCNWTAVLSFYRR